jgi:hypothetical protein
VTLIYMLRCQQNSVKSWDCNEDFLSIIMPRTACLKPSRQTLTMCNMTSFCPTVRYSIQSKPRRSHTAVQDPDNLHTLHYT